MCETIATATREEPLSVLHIFSGDLWAGAEVVIYTLLKELASTPSVNVRALALNEGTLTKKLREVGVRVLVLPEAEHTMLEIVRLAHRQLHDEPIQIIHTHRYKENLLGWILGKMLKIPCRIATLHGLPESPTAQGNRGWRGSFANFVDSMVLRWGFTRIVAVSRDMETVLTKIGTFQARQLRVIHNGIFIPQEPDGSRIAASQPLQETFRIGTVCRLVPVKGLDLFLDIAAAVLQCLPNTHFSILGEGPLRTQLEKKAYDLGIQSHVEFLPPREDPFPFYRSLDLYLNTSVHEGIPCSILEAMGCRLAVVAPRVGGIPEIVKHQETGLLVFARSPEAFVEAIRLLESNEVLRKAMGEKARVAIETHFGAAAMAASYGALYCESLTA